MARYLGQLFLLFCVCVYAWRRGAEPERAAAATMILMFAMDPPYHAIWGNRTVYQELNIGHLVIDMITLAIFVPIALLANRRWTILMASAQAVAVLSHFLRWISPDMHPWVYAGFIRVPSYLQIAFLFIGTERHRRRVKRIGNYPSWQHSLRRR
jgi:hypothetical protein